MPQGGSFTGSPASAPGPAQPMYLLPTEAEPLLAKLLPSGDRGRIAFEAASSDDQALFLAQATRDIDAVRWQGQDADSEQVLRWPRVTRTPGRSPGITPSPWSAGVSTYLDADPDATGNESVAGLPKAVKAACALQAAHLALRASGLDPTARLDEAARRGVSAVSGSGRSESIDLRTANSPWARLCLDAQQRMERHRAVSAMST